MNRSRSNLATSRRRGSDRSVQQIYFTFEDLGRKDFLTGLILWIVIEIVSFILLPGMGAIQPGPRLQTWFTLSIPFGLGGAFLLAASSRFVAITHERSVGSKSLLNLVGQFGGWVGLAGILFPFVMVAGEFLSKAFKLS